MTIMHIVAFTSQASPKVQRTLITSFQALLAECIHPTTGKPYIKTFKSGKQNSPEEWTKGLELIFCLEFENLEDRDYYINEDPAHARFGLDYNYEQGVLGMRLGYSLTNRIESRESSRS